MKRFLVFLFLSGLIVCTWGCEKAEEPAVEPAETQEAAVEEKPSAEMTELMVKTATVKAVDYDTRVVVLEDPEGNVVTFEAGEEVQNLAQVEVGDKVVARFLRSVAVAVWPADEEVPAGAELSQVAVAAPGEKPGILIADTMQMHALVKAIDRENRLVTCEGPEGGLEVFKVADQVKLDAVEVGQNLVVVYTEALGISVEEPADDEM
jgi:Na+-transporting methylmalonyl-CoA/oxaloacetate decarboxylase gamma subunit